MKMAAAGDHLKIRDIVAKTPPKKTILYDFHRERLPCLHCYYNRRQGEAIGGGGGVDGAEDDEDTTTTKKDRMMKWPMWPTIARCHRRNRPKEEWDIDGRPDARLTPFGLKDCRSRLYDLCGGVCHRSDSHTRDNQLIIDDSCIEFWFIRRKDEG